MWWHILGSRWQWHSDRWVGVSDFAYPHDHDLYVCNIPREQNDQGLHSQDNSSIYAILVSIGEYPSSLGETPNR